MKAVLISIQPQYCKPIANGVKTLEIRKNRPKLKPPFTCYIYCTKHTGPNDLLELHDENGRIHKMNGKVIAEFTCDRIDPILPGCEYCTDGYDIDDDTLEATCLTREALMAYGKGHPLYAWHISNLQVYDKPKELSVYKNIRLVRGYHRQGENKFEKLLHSKHIEVTFLNRPPQSWCYVAEI